MTSFPVQLECRCFKTIEWHHRSRTEAFYVSFCCFYVWRIGHHSLKLYWIWLQRCLPLKLLKCFVDSNTSPPPAPPSAQWWVDNESTIPVRMQDNVWRHKPYCLSDTKRFVSRSLLHLGRTYETPFGWTSLKEFTNWVNCSPMLPWRWSVK